MYFELEPLLLIGEGTYALISVKEMAGTESFFELGEKIRKCQNRGTSEDCLAKDFLQKSLKKCNCTPFRLRNYTKKVKSSYQYN